jgi:hypothetical protein
MTAEGRKIHQSTGFSGAGELREKYKGTFQTLESWTLVLVSIPLL